MLTPVSGPAVPFKTSTTPVETTQGAQATVRSPLGPTAAEGGPARLKPETLRAIDPTRQSEASLSLSSDGSDQTDTRPAGPPPAFVETLLERQARVAFDPPETAPPPEADTPSIPPEAQAEAGFAETRALANEPKPPEIDRKE